MEGEDEESTEEGAFNKAPIIMRVAVVIAGATINIVFGFIVYFILAILVFNNMGLAIKSIGEYGLALIQSIKMLFTGQVGLNELTGPVGISEMVAKTSSFKEYLYMMSIISVSLGVTNLLPIPALDGGKIVLLLIEAIRKKPVKESVQIGLQLIGFTLLIILSVFVTYKDIFRLLN